MLGEITVLQGFVICQLVCFLHKISQVESQKVSTALRMWVYDEAGHQTFAFEVVLKVQFHFISCVKGSRETVLTAGSLIVQNLAGLCLLIWTYFSLQRGPSTDTGFLQLTLLGSCRWFLQFNPNWHSFSSEGLSYTNNPMRYRYYSIYPQLIKNLPSQENLELLKE